MSDLANLLPNRQDHNSSSYTQRTYAFVVLHYMRADLTQSCVESVLRLRMPNAQVQVVIVDNASPNRSGDAIEALYADSKDVSVVRNKDNLGFSKANNIGFEYATRWWDPDAVLVLNNDIQIVQEDFLVRLQSILDRDEYHVISPDVYAPKTDAHQGPLRTFLIDEDEIQKRITHYTKAATGRHPHPVRYWMKRLPIMRHIVDLRKRKRKAEQDVIAASPWQNVVLQGAALIFTRKFIQTKQKPFYPETFLYYEEDILAVRCQRNGWLTLYTPELQVLHFHGCATNEIVKSPNEKAVFIAKHYVDSLRVLLSYQKEDIAITKGENRTEGGLE